MGIVITGASGFVGRNIISILLKSEEKLLLVGRDKEKLKKLFPSIDIADYNNLKDAAKGYDTLVHLAVRNNDKHGSIEEFREANVKQFEDVARSAKAADIKTLIYTTALHASDEGNSSPYDQNKREAEELLSKIEGIVIVKLRLPAVYSKTYTGKLKLLAKVPTPLRPIAFKFLAALKPTVHINHVAKAIQINKNRKQNIELIVTDRQAKNWFYDIIKRMIDLSFAVFVAVFLWWVLVIAWIAVKFSSPGSGIFAQQRIGKDGELFTCYKFRTMRDGTKQVGTHEVTPDSITKVGSFLRKTKIDELPQIWNIFKNELSLVGPRPCLPVQEELIAQRSKRGVLDIKGGITGLAQIQNVDMSDAKRLAKLDEEYLSLQSILFDIKIIIATMTGRGQGDKVRR